MVVLSNTVNTPPLGWLSLYHIEERNRRTGTKEKLCKQWLVEAAATASHAFLRLEQPFLKWRYSMKNSQILLPTLPLCPSCCACYYGLFYVVVVLKMEATDFLATMMQNCVFLGETANSHCNQLVIVCRSPESQPCSRAQKNELQKFWALEQGWLALIND